MFQRFGPLSSWNKVWWEHGSTHSMGAEAELHLEIEIGGEGARPSMDFSNLSAHLQLHASRNKDAYALTMSGLLILTKECHSLND